PADARADLYALGIVLYELLTGERPFVGEDLNAIYAQHLYANPLPPSALNATIPSALEVLILRLLEKDPAQRPQSAAQVRQALEGIDLAPSSSPSLRGKGTPALAEGGLGIGPYRRSFAGRDPEVRQLRTAY